MKLEKITFHPLGERGKVGFLLKTMNSTNAGQCIADVMTQLKNITSFEGESFRTHIHENAPDIKIQWDNTAKVSHLGGVVCFTQFLRLSGVLDLLSKEAPLNYKSNNASRPRDIFGTIFAGLCAGNKHFSNLDRIRNDEIIREAFRMKNRILRYYSSCIETW